MVKLAKVVLVHRRGERLVFELPNCLSYEIADNTTIINIHTRSISIENSSNPYLCYES